MLLVNLSHGSLTRKSGASKIRRAITALGGNAPGQTASTAHRTNGYASLSRRCWMCFATDDAISICFGGIFRYRLEASRTAGHGESCPLAPAGLSSYTPSSPSRQRSDIAPRWVQTRLAAENVAYNTADVHEQVSYKLSLLPKRI